MQFPNRAIEFQLRDIFFSDTLPLASSVDPESQCGDSLLEEVRRLQDLESSDGGAYSRVLTATLFGRMHDGSSICVIVYGFRPELYYDASVPDHHIRAAANNRGKIHIETVQRFDAGDCRLDDDGNKLSSTYKRVSYSLQSSYKRACYCEDPRAHHTIPKLESKFFVHSGLIPEGWVSLNVNNAKRRGPLGMKQECISWATHEFEAAMGDLSPIDRAEFAPLVMCALDIEAVSDKEEFPNFNEPRDYVCAISVVSWVNGSPLTTPPQRYCVCLHETSAVDGATIIHRATEREELIALRDLMRKLDPDIILTWNGCGFDWRYLYERSKLTHCQDFLYLSQLRYHECTFTTKPMKSGARGDQELEFFAMPGRTNMDLMQWYMSNYKKDSYALNNVAFAHTGDKKKDFDYKLIRPYFYGTSDQRGEMAAYCIQDSELLRALCEQLKTIGDQVELSRVCRVIMERLTTHGQGIKVVSQLNAKCVNMRSEGYDFDFILDNRNVASHAERKARDVSKGEGEEEEEGYEGAIVIDAKTGYYKKRVIIVMDFSSLYPSIMIGDNVDKSTLVRHPGDFGKQGVVAHDIGAVGRVWKHVATLPVGYAVVENKRLALLLQFELTLSKQDHKNMNFKSLKMRTAVPDGRGTGYFIPDDGHVYHFTTKNKGIMSAMLEETLVRRKIAKKEKERAEARLDRLAALEQEGTEEARILADQILAYEKRQLALKVSANSAYGFLGAERTGSYPDKAVAATVTACGRDMLMDSCDVCKEVATTLTKRSNGEPVGDFDLVYGDTDSLMVTCENINDPVDGYYAGVAMSTEVTKRFHAKGQTNKKLEMEKCFFPWVLFSKKKYAGILYEMGHEGLVVSRGAKFSGTANKRRDSCKYVHKTYDAMIHPLLYELDDAKCITKFHEHMRILVDGKAPFEDLVITKSIQSTYKNDNLAQCKVVAKQKKREPGSETKPGGRLKMVFCKGPRDAKIGDLAEDADYAEKNNVPIDICVYVKSQMWTPLESLLQQVHSNPTALLQFYLDEAKRRSAGVPSFAEFAKNLPMRRKSPAADVKEVHTMDAETVAETATTASSSMEVKPATATGVDRKKKGASSGMSESITKWMKK